MRPIAFVCALSKVVEGQVSLSTLLGILRTYTNSFIFVYSDSPSQVNAKSCVRLYSIDFTFFSQNQIFRYVSLSVPKSSLVKISLHSKNLE